jgi:uncharacterized zinc-type alcohol dehydrogenase-like protein
MGHSGLTPAPLPPGIKTAGYAARSATSPLSLFNFERRRPGPSDVQVEILYCGVCHTDLHFARNQWQSSSYPLVPGHEIIGRVVKVGRRVSRFQPGDLAAVGPMVDSCHHCEACAGGLEQYCLNGPTFTYNQVDDRTGERTYGGYSANIVVTEEFVLKVPGDSYLGAMAPLVCAGITTYSPLRHWKASRSKRVGIAGLGGLGHMGVKLARAMGARVTAITTSPWKAADAPRLGAVDVVLSTDEAAMDRHASSLDLILSTIPVSHDINPYLELLRRDGTLVILGGLEPLEPGLDGDTLALARRCVSGSFIGSPAETQEMIDFCVRHSIAADVEVIPIQKINDAYERLLKRDVKYRFVIDMSSLKLESGRP